MEAGPRHHNPFGAVAGGVYSALADVAMGVALAARVCVRLCVSAPITIIRTSLRLICCRRTDPRPTNLTRGGCHAPIKSGLGSSDGGGRHNRAWSIHLGRLPT
jgi:hypothetical protein